MIWRFALVFCLCCGPVFNSISSYLDVSYIVAFILTLKWISLKRKKFPRFYRNFLPLYLVLFLVMLLSFSNGAIFLQYFVKLIRISLILVAVHVLYDQYSQDGKNDILFLAYWSLVLNGVVMILQFVNPAFKEFTYSFLTNGIYRSTFEYDFRMGGLTGTTGGAVLSVLQSLGFILGFHPEIRSKTIVATRVASLFILLLSSLMAGRSGVLLVLLFSMYQSTRIVLFGSIARKVITAFSISLLIATLPLVFRSIDSLDKTPLRHIAKRNFSFLEETFLNGDFQNDATVSTLYSNHLFIPGIDYLFIGDLENVLNSGFGRKIKSDIGYVRDIWTMGYFPSLMYYLPYVLIVFGISSSSHSATLRFIVLASLIFHFKEIFLYARGVFPFTLIISYQYLKKSRICAAL